MRPLLPGAAVLALAGIAVLGVGCEQRAHPWDQGDAAAPPPSPPWRTGDTSSPLGSALAADPSPAENGATPAQEGEGALDDAGAVSPPVRVGGPWVRCYGNFRPSGDPIKDVTRLSVLCGPENGMRRLSKRPIEGAVAEGSPGVSQTFEARRGECYRVFAVAEPTVGDLDVTVQSSRGAPVAGDHGEDSWPIVQPDRPFCPLADDRYTVEISAHRGRGKFAAEVWVLRTPTPGRPRIGRNPGRSADPTD